MAKQGIYMESLVSPVISLIAESGIGLFLGWCGKIRLYWLKRQLYRNVSKEILNKYGDEVYYSDLDAFLTNYRVIYHILQNGTQTSIFRGQTKREIITYYICIFMEKHPEYQLYQNEIRQLMRECFEVIFETLNRIHSKELQALCNIAKEFAFEVTEELQEVRRVVDKIDKKTDYLVSEAAGKNGIFLKEKYLEYLLYLYPQYSSASYLERKLYASDEKREEEDAVTVLLDERKVIVLGEAGFGKTYESVILLNRVCRDERMSGLTPIYFSLQEYGVLYSDIADGIRYKLDPFCEGDQETLINQWMREGRFIFIFDGMDDIPTEDFRRKFIMEANDFLCRYYHNYFFFTSRFNRYHRELGRLKEYRLTVLGKEVIQEEFRKAGVYVKVPESYYQLFSNPLFLEIGKKVLMQNEHYDIFNRSQLFDELFLQLYGGRERGKDYSAKAALTCSEILHVLGKFAYETFSYSSYSYLEFDDRLSKVIEKNRAETIASVISSGLFKVSENITFLHKLFKEYCAAYYLAREYPLEEHAALYRELVSREEWKEVFIFISGLFEDREAQDAFLDFVMAENLPLYVECIKAKSDLLRNEGQLDNKDLAGRLLSQIRKTYSYIALHYFGAIAGWFDPQLPKGGDRSGPIGKIGIVGWLSENGNGLNYWLDAVSEEEEEVRCLCEGEAPVCYAAFKEKALRERGNACIHYLNLQRAGRQGDSGRQIAIDLIKNELKKVFDKKRLIEGNWLICEKILKDREKIKEIKDSLDLREMQDIIDGWIDEAKQIRPNIMGYDRNGVELFSLQKLLHDMSALGVELTDYMLPGPDKLETAEYPCWTWDLYSKEQIEKRTVFFFYYHELCYLDMVVKNFPNLYACFLRYQDIPYQVIIDIDYKENEDRTGFYSGPSIRYYYVAAEGEEIPIPVVSEGSDASTLEEMERIWKKIRESYQKMGRTAHMVSYTSTLFAKIEGTGLPLSEHVYQSIKESLEEIFGKI